MRRRSLLAMLGGLAGAVAAPAAWHLDSATDGVLGATTVLAGEPARRQRPLGYVPMAPSAVIALTGGAGEMTEIDLAAYGVPARAAGVHLAGWARIERPGKLWAFSDESGQHGGAYHVREASVDWMFVPATRGEVCVMGSAPWGLDVRITGYWI